MVEHKTEHKNEHKKELKIAKSTFYQMLTAVLAVALIISVGMSFMGTGITGGLGADKAGQKVVEYINTNLIPSGGEQATFVNATEKGGMYLVTTAYKGQNIEIYTSKDGSMLFLSAINMNEALPTMDQTTTEPEVIPQTANPTVGLFVMSFCPYGIQAEQTMKPVVDLLGSAVSIMPHFIVSVSGDTISSLHGDVEVQEDMRQACIIKEYGLSTFWKYVDKFNSNCTIDNANTCWKTITPQFSINTTKIESCVSTDGLTLMKAEAALTEQAGVSGSPTLLINEVAYSGARTTDAYKTGICSAFTTAPTECSQNLSNVSSTANGSC